MRFPAKGTALLGICHDAETRHAVADRVVDVSQFSRKLA
jgi:alpha-D-ribose 1-methylphosphonate 5-triphosphate synthase subunit PhnL